VDLPTPRGPLSQVLATTLATPVQLSPHVVEAARAAAAAAEGTVLRDDDFQLSCAMLYELHYTGLDGTDPDWEWSPDLLSARAVLEQSLEQALRDLTAPALARLGADLAGSKNRQDVADLLTELVRQDDGPSLAAHVERRATAEQVRELLVHRSIYQLKEADPHSWAIPRLSGPAKVALVEVQFDEYGAGRAEWQHAALFAQTLRCAGLDDRAGAYLDAVPAITLAHLNVMSLFGLHRSLRGAVAGHLAALEMTSCVPNRRYGNAMRKHGLGDEAAAYFDEHVEADAVHEQVAARDLCGRLVEGEPHLLPDVLHGAAASLAMDAALADHLIGAWADGRSSLRGPLSDQRLGAEAASATRRRRRL
jgi:hypothetical protein